ncbi:hypothetical protein J4418_02845 [Candidatus Woesearchaeota archaeon]|nr:hypothetical protein [Candidatus Woesearchaeota archaeon]
MKNFLIFLTLIILLSFNVSADSFPYNLFSGTITLNSSNAPIGSVLSATIGGINAGSYTLNTAGWYALIVTGRNDANLNANDGDAITFSLSSTGWTITAITGNTYSDSKEDGSPRWLNLAFTGSTSASATTTAGSGAGSGGGDAATTVETVFVPTKITQPSVIAQILSWITPSELGLESLSADDVIITELNEITEKSEIGVGDLGPLLNEVTSNAVKTALDDLQALLDAKEGQKLEVNKILKVYKIQSKINNEIVLRTLLSVTVTALSDMTDVKVIEVIPKNVAKHVSELIFLGEQPKVLQDDPVVQWEIPVISQGLSKTFEYVVKKELVNFEGKTITVGVSSALEEVTGGAVEPEVSPPNPIWGWIIGIVLIVLGLAWYFRKNR